MNGRAKMEEVLRVKGTHNQWKFLERNLPIGDPVSRTATVQAMKIAYYMATLRLLDDFVGAEDGDEVKKVVELAMNDVTEFLGNEKQSAPCFKDRMKVLGWLDVSVEAIE